MAKKHPKTSVQEVIVAVPEETPAPAVEEAVAPATVEETPTVEAPAVEEAPKVTKSAAETLKELRERQKKEREELKEAMRKEREARKAAKVGKVRVTVFTRVDAIAEAIKEMTPFEDTKDLAERADAIYLEKNKKAKTNFRETNAIVAKAIPLLIDLGFAKIVDKKCFVLDASNIEF